MQDFQEAIGSEISKRQEFITKEEIDVVTNEIIQKFGSTFKSRNDFLEVFPYSLSVIVNRYGSFDAFINSVNIIILKTKKAKYTKQEVDECILAYLKSGKPIPLSAKELSSVSLPSSSTILRFYDNWKEPFVIFSKMISSNYILLILLHIFFLLIALYNNLIFFPCL